MVEPAKSYELFLGTEHHSNLIREDYGNNSVFIGGEARKNNFSITGKVGIVYGKSSNPRLESGDSLSSIEIRYYLK